MTNQISTLSLADLSTVTGGVAVRNVGRVVNGVVGVGAVGVDSVVKPVVGNVNKPVVGVDNVGVVGPRVVQ